MLIPLKQVPQQLLRPLEGVAKTSLYTPKPLPSQILLAMGDELPTNIRVQNWSHLDKNRWVGIPSSVRDGVYNKKTKTWETVGLKRLLRSY